VDEKGHVFGPPPIIVASNDTDALTYAKRWIDSRDLEIGMRRGAWASLRVAGANSGEVEGATLTKEAPDASKTPGSLLPPVNDFARTQGRRQDDFFREPPARRATKMGSSCASADAVHS
jgi:hypothetical protein